MKVLVTAALLSALAATLPSAAGSRGPLTLRFVSVVTSHATRDVNPKGASAGDTSTDTDRLLNGVAQLGHAKRFAVGRDRGVFTLTSKTTAKFNGRATILGSTLIVKGKVTRVSGGVRIPVVGGTLRFAGARGTVTVTAGDGPSRALNVYRLRFVGG